MSHDTSTGHALQALAMWGQDKAFGSSQKDRLHYIYIADSQNPYYIIEISIANYMCQLHNGIDIEHRQQFLVI